MRVALVADEDRGWGGIGTYTGVMGKGRQTLGHDVHLVLRGWEEPEAETLEGMTVHRVSVPEPGWSRGTVAVVSRLYGTRDSLIFSARAARVLAQIRPDVVEAPEFHGAGLVVALRTRLQRREAIADQTDGLLVAPENPAALANAVTRLLLDAAERRRLGRAARARVTRCFATKPVATPIAEHYAELTR